MVGAFTFSAAIFLFSSLIFSLLLALLPFSNTGSLYICSVCTYLPPSTTLSLLCLNFNLAGGQRARAKQQKQNRSTKLVSLSQLQQQAQLGITVSTLFSHTMAEVRDFEKMSSTGSNRRRACRYLKDGEKFFTYLNVLLERLEKAASASPGVTDDTIVVEKTVREVKTINLKPAERQQIDSHFVELIEVAKRKVARVKELMVYGDGGSSLTQVDTTSSSKQEEAEQPKCKRLYDDGRPLLNSTDCQLLLHQRLNSYRKEMLNESINQQKIVNFNNNNSLEHPVPSTSKEADNFSHNEPPANSTVAPLPPNATPKQIFALLLSLEEEHFRAASFERAVQAASDTLSVLTGGVCVSGGGNFGVITATLVGELKEYRQTLDDRQIVDVIGAFNAAFTGLRETVPTAYSHHQNTLGAPSKPTDPPEIVDYLVALAALLTATSQLRPAAADVLRSLFTSSVDQLVLYTAGQLSLLTGDLLAPSSTVLQSKSNPLEQQDHHAYRCLVDGALLLLGRIFSHRSPIDGLGAKVGGEALNALLTALLPFYVLRLGFCHRHTSLYQPVEKFAEGRLFHGRTEREIATMAKYDETINKLTPVNCTALLTVLLRLLVRLTTEPMAVMAEVLMVPPSALEGPVSAAQEEVNQQPLFRSPLNANFNMSSVEEARIMAKTLLNTFWEKAGKLLRQMELSKWIENRGTAFKTTIEEMLWQLHLLFESYSGRISLLLLLLLKGKNTCLSFSFSPSDPPNTDHLNKEMVALANDTAGRALSYMAKNLGPRIWYYFGKVNKELDKRPFKDAVVGGCGGTSVMVAYLNSLSLGRPVELEEEEEEEVVVGESDVEEDNGDENENEIYDDDAAAAESDEKCLVEEEKVPKEDQNDLNAGELEETAPVEKSSSSHLQSSAEQALATFSTSMLRMASQMINSVELFVKDIAQIEECLKVS